jgi:hypothetical protein
MGCCGRSRAADRQILRNTRLQKKPGHRAQAGRRGCCGVVHYDTYPKSRTLLIRRLSIPSVVLAFPVNLIICASYRLRKLERDVIRGKVTISLVCGSTEGAPWLVSDHDGTAGSCIIGFRSSLIATVPEGADQQSIFYFKELLAQFGRLCEDGCRIGTLSYVRRQYSL